MSVYADALDQLAQQVAAGVGVAATRDPSEVIGLVSRDGGCALIGFPTHVNRLLGGPNLQVPVFLITGAPSDLRAVDWLLDHLDALIVTCGSKSVSNGPVDIGSITFPAVTVTAELAITTT